MSSIPPPNVPNPPDSSGRAPLAAGSAPGPPSADMSASPEMRAWLEQLQRQDRQLGVQNRALAIALAVGIVAALVVLWLLYRATVGAYASLDGLTAEQHPASPGHIDFSFRVTRPGRVHYRRTSDGRVTEMVDYFRTGGAQNRSWSWSYTPGDDLVVTLWHRSWLRRRRRAWRFPTTRRLDVVMLIDTTESMGASIQHLKTHCADFSERVIEQGWQPRYALVAFGSRESDPWLHRQAPTPDMLEFIVAVDRMPRFPDGPALGSSLDALEEALAMPFEEGSTRRFFLVTDNGFHPETSSGATPEEISERLARRRIRLDVFSLSQWRDDYEPLLGTAGRFYPLERFGKLVTHGHVLED